LSPAVGAVPEQLVRRLAELLDIRRAVETGTYLGESTEVLVRIFGRVETIELSRRLAWRAQLKFLFRPGVKVRRGDSAKLLQQATEPTFYWLDAHWSGGITAGREHECPVVDEIRCTSPGDPSDCYLIDDAHMFTKPVPPPHDQRHWPRLGELETVVARERAGHVLVVGDRLNVLAVIPRDAVDVIELVEEP
jgi:hypothetical protein